MYVILVGFVYNFNVYFVLGSIYGAEQIVIGVRMVWSWLIVGVILMVLEIILPGMVVVFLGLGALFVALLIWMGWISSIAVSIVAWIGSSLVLLIVLRTLVQKLMPGDVETQSTDDDIDAYGTVVEVIETINAEKPGRILFRDTSWSATSSGDIIEAGQKAKIIYRENLEWVVEPHYFDQLD